MKYPKKRPSSTSDTLSTALEDLINSWKSNESFSETNAAYYENFISKVFSANNEDFDAGIMSFGYIIDIDLKSYTKEHGLLTIISTLISYWDAAIKEVEEEHIEMATYRIQEVLKKLSTTRAPDLSHFYKCLLLQKVYNNPKLDSWEKRYRTADSLIDQQQKYIDSNIISQNAQYFRIHKIVPVLSKEKEREPKKYLYLLHGEKIEPEESENLQKDVYQFSLEHRTILATYPPALKTFLEHPSVMKYIESNPHHRVSFTTTLLLSKDSWQNKIAEKFPYLKKFLP